MLIHKGYQGSYFDYLGHSSVKNRPVRDLNPGPPASLAGIITLDQQATCKLYYLLYIYKKDFCIIYSFFVQDILI